MRSDPSGNGGSLDGCPSPEQQGSKEARILPAAPKPQQRQAVSGCVRNPATSRQLARSPIWPKLRGIPRTERQPFCNSPNARCSSIYLYAARARRLQATGAIPMLDSFATRDTLKVNGSSYQIASLAKFGQKFDLKHLPYSMKILLENLLRHEDGVNVTQKEIEAVAKWDPKA